MAKQKTTTNPGRRGDTDKNTLYCSFCGKSQHEVKKLIAGPTVFICDECIELCSDIVYREPGKDNLEFLDLDLKEPIDNLSIARVDSIVSQLSQLYPEIKFKVDRVYKTDSGSVIVIIYGDSTGRKVEDELREEIKTIAEKLKVAQNQYFNEITNRKSIENDFKKLKEDVFPIIYQKLIETGQIPDRGTKPLLCMALDVRGFSELPNPRQLACVKMLQGIAAPILEESDAMLINTWGDAIVAAFKDINIGIICSCKFIKHLDVEGFDSRIGLSFGNILIRENALIQRSDGFGDAIVEASRLEACADTNEVLISTETRYHPTVNEDLFEFREKNVMLKKGYNEKNPGEMITAFHVRLKPNA